MKNEITDMMSDKFYYMPTGLRTTRAFQLLYNIMRAIYNEYFSPASFRRTEESLLYTILKTTSVRFINNEVVLQVDKCIKNYAIDDFVKQAINEFELNGNLSYIVICGSCFYDTYTQIENIYGTNSYTEDIPITTEARANISGIACYNTQATSTAEKFQEFERVFTYNENHNEESFYGIPLTLLIDYEFSASLTDVAFICKYLRNINKTFDNIHDIFSTELEQRLYIKYVGCEIQNDPISRAILDTAVIEATNIANKYDDKISSVKTELERAIQALQKELSEKTYELKRERNNKILELTSVCGN